MTFNEAGFDTVLPKGVKDFLPVNAAKINYLEKQLTDLFRTWSFRPIIPSSLEFHEVLERGLGRDLRDRVFRSDDRQSNRVAAFTPDITPQIARIVATRMTTMPLPLRLYYSGRVLRHVESQAGKGREIFQTGVELVGLQGPEADAEMIAMTVESLRAIGAKEFTVDIGQIDFFRGLLEDVPETARPQICAAIGRKEHSELQRLLGEIDLSEQLNDAILALPRLFGGPEILDRADAIAINDRCKAALDNLRRMLDTLAVYQVLDCITIDLGEISSLDYHTGITFKAYIPGVGKAVCSGGRYDGLTAKYGFNAPATGFTFSLLNLLFALEKDLNEVAREESHALIFQEGADKKTAQLVAIALRNNGISAARDIFPRSKEDSLDYAKRSHFKYLIEIETDDRVAIIKVADGTSQRYSLDQIVSTDFVLA